MNGRVHLRIVFLFGGFVAFDLACQALSPYPDVYDKVYEAGSQTPQLVASAAGDASVATEDDAEGALDGETVDGDSESTASTPTCPPGATVFAAADGPQTITLDTTNAYWTNAPGGTGTGSVAYLARASAGGAAKTLAPKLGAPLFIANAGGYVAWSELGTVGLVNVMSMTISTFTFTTTASSRIAGVAVGPTDAYWLSSSGGVISVQSAPVIGGSAVQVGTVSTASLPGGLSIQGNTLYFAAYGRPGNSPGQGGAIYQVPTAGGTPTAMQTFSPATGGTPNDLVTDSNNIYWTDLYAGGGSVFSMPLAGGTITTMASMLGVPPYLAVDSNNVYTADFKNGSVYEIPLGTPAGAGGTPKVLATGVGPLGVAADDNQAVVYFTSASAICTVPK